MGVVMIVRSLVVEIKSLICEKNVESLGLNVLVNMMTVLRLVNVRLLLTVAMDFWMKSLKSVMMEMMKNLMRVVMTVLSLLVAMRDGMNEKNVVNLNFFVMNTMSVMILVDVNMSLIVEMESSMDQ